MATNQTPQMAIQKKITNIVGAAIKNKSHDIDPVETKTSSSLADALVGDLEAKLDSDNKRNLTTPSAIRTWLGTDRVDLSGPHKIFGRLVKLKVQYVKSTNTVKITVTSRGVLY